MKYAVTLALTFAAGLAVGGRMVPALQAQPAEHGAYVIAETHVTDPAGFMEYLRHETATLAPYHGRTLARALPDTREGAPPDGMVTLIAFGSLQDANRWYNSPEYMRLLPLAQRAAKSRVYFLDGVVQ